MPKHLLSKSEEELQAQTPEDRAKASEKAVDEKLKQDQDERKQEAAAKKEEAKNLEGSGKGKSFAQQEKEAVKDAPEEAKYNHPDFTPPAL